MPNIKIPGIVEQCTKFLSAFMCTIITPYMVARKTVYYGCILSLLIRWWLKWITN